LVTERRSFIDETVSKQLRQEYQNKLTRFNEQSFVERQHEAKKISPKLFRESVQVTKLGRLQKSFTTFNIVRAYASTSSNDRLYYICGNTKRYDNDQEWLIAIYKDEVILVCCTGGHFAVATDKFIHGNSDGSGPNMLGYVLNGDEANGDGIHDQNLVEKITPEVWCKTMLIMFDQICLNNGIRGLLK